MKYGEVGDYNTAMKLADVNINEFHRSKSIVKIIKTQIRIVLHGNDSKLLFPNVKYQKPQSSGNFESTSVRHRIDSCTPFKYLTT